MGRKVKKIGRYEVIRRLGKGGMGTVYKAIVPEIEKVVALKLLEPAEIMEDILGMDKLREIFLFEAKTMASFHQPFLVTAHDYNFDGHGRPFFVMEYICKNLGDMIGEHFQVEKESRVIPPEKVIYYGQQLLQALAFLHYNNIIHRDIKPHNILVTDDDVIKICDFGMALVDGVSFSGPDTMQIGSPYYTPPEQRKNPAEVDGRADLYSAAVLLYRMLTGNLPGMQSFSLSQVNPLYTTQWDDFFSKALEWQPDKRFASAEDMLFSFKKLQLNKVHPHKSVVKGPDKFEHHHTIRSQIVNVCKSRAAATFQTDHNFAPIPGSSIDWILENNFLIDASNNLIWQRNKSRFPLTQKYAQEYTANLKNGYADWRLPTVNELLTLCSRQDLLACFFMDESQPFWVWSCDLHGKQEGWYVNLDLGYTGNQDVNCLNYVLPVSSFSDTIDLQKIINRP